MISSGLLLPASIHSRAVSVAAPKTLAITWAQVPPTQPWGRVPQTGAFVCVCVCMVRGFKR